MLKKPLAEICLIFLISAVLGIAWNHALLMSAWRGEAISPPPVQGGAQAPAAAQGEEPLPLGLMQVKEMIDAKEAVLVDARDAESYAAGHLPGALSLPLEVAQKGIPASFRGKAPPQKMLIAYCNGFSCHDSMEVGKALMKSGYRTVYVFEGGFPEWRDAGYPLEQGVKP